MKQTTKSNLSFAGYDVEISFSQGSGQYFAIAISNRWRFWIRAKKGIEF